MEKASDLIERFLDGDLSAEEKDEFLARLEVEEDLRNELAAEKSARAAFEYQIAEDTRALAREWVDKDIQKRAEKPRTLPLYITGIAASLLILVTCVWSINYSHGDFALADNYHINAFASRDGNEFSDPTFTEAVKAYYRNDFDQARSILSQHSTDLQIVEQNKDWLELLLSLKTEGSDSESFRKRLSEITDNENHEFYGPAHQLQDDLNLFWRRFVVKK